MVLSPSPVSSDVRVWGRGGHQTFSVFSVLRVNLESSTVVYVLTLHKCASLLLPQLGAVNTVTDVTENGSLADPRELSRMSALVGPHARGLALSLSGSGTHSHILMTHGGHRQRSCPEDPVTMC